MNVVNYPVSYQSAFRPATFVMSGVEAASGLDVSVLPATGTEPLGVKRIYGSGQIAVNAAPYVCGLLAPQPLCAQPMGMLTDQRRYAGCRVSAGSYTSAVVHLTAGTEDAPVNRVLSAAPETLRIRPDDKDEISVITAGAAVKPFVMFTHGGRDYTLDSLSANSGTGMHTFVVDTTAVATAFAQMTGAAESDMDAFTVVLRVAAAGGDIYLTRRYEVDAAPHNSRRLAWVNRFGAVDYYTFPVVAECKFSGRKSRITTADGVRTVATSGAEWLTLVSGFETVETLGWLAEVLSSPRVWTVEGDVCEEVDVADASAGFAPLEPGMLAITVRKSRKVVSRKF